MCSFRIDCKRMIFFFAVSLTTYFIGVGFSNRWQPFDRQNAVIVSNRTTAQSISHAPKVIRKEPRFKQSYTCQEINNYHSSKARSKIYVEVGILNGESCFVEPIYPKEALENAISGQVNVEVLVDGFGVVRSAKAIAGAELLLNSAVEAAYKTRVHPRWLGGQPVNVKGLLIYEFVVPE